VAAAVLLLEVLGARPERSRANRVLRKIAQAHVLNAQREIEAPLPQRCLEQELVAGEAIVRVAAAWRRFEEPPGLNAGQVAKEERPRRGRRRGLMG
jgi:hypothetical protein